MVGIGSRKAMGLCMSRRSFLDSSIRQASPFGCLLKLKIDQNWVCSKLKICNANSAAIEKVL